MTEITISVDTSQDFQQIFISEEYSSGYSYDVPKGLSINDAIIKALRNYLEFETKRWRF